MVWACSEEDSDNSLQRMLDLKVVQRKRQGRLKMTWKKQVEEEIKKIELKKEDAIDRVNGAMLFMRF